MANYQLLKADIDAKVYQNGKQEITGENLNSVLNAMVTTLGAEYQFAGVATKDTNPEISDAKVFYIANGKGTYTNFGGIEVTEDEVVVLYWDSSWHKEATGIASQAKLTELESEAIYDVSAHNNNAVFESLQVLLSSSSLSTLIPTSVRHGGMSIRFIQGSVPNSDNKYVQYRLMSDSFNTTPANWQGVDDKPTAESDNLVKSGGAYNETVISKHIAKNSSILAYCNAVSGVLVYVPETDANRSAVYDVEGFVGDLKISTPMSGNLYVAVCGFVNTLEGGTSIINMSAATDITSEASYVCDGTQPKYLLVSYLVSDDATSVIENQHIKDVVEEQEAEIEQNKNEIHRVDELIQSTCINLKSITTEQIYANSVSHNIQEGSTTLMSDVYDVEGKVGLLYIKTSGISNLYVSLSAFADSLNLSSPVYNSGKATDVANEDYIYLDGKQHKYLLIPKSSSVTETDAVLFFQFLTDRKIDTYVPRVLYALRDRDYYIYPHNILSVHLNDFTFSCSINSQNNIFSDDKMFWKIFNQWFNPSGIPTSEILSVKYIGYDNAVKDIGNILVKAKTPEAPVSDMFILPIGDSLMYSANLEHHGVFNNELSRLINGTGGAAPNGHESLSYTNVHIIGTLTDDNVNPYPIKYEGRGGWSVANYLHDSSPFINPNTGVFDLGYYLSNNGFITQGVQSDGSNLCVMLELNWNSFFQDNDAWLNDYRTLLESIHTSCPNAKVLLLGMNVPPSGSMRDIRSGFMMTNANIKKRIFEMERSLDILEDEYNYVYHVPVAPMFYPDGAYPELSFARMNQRTSIVGYPSDYVHPNEVGYGQMADIALAAYINICL